MKIGEQPKETKKKPKETKEEKKRIEKYKKEYAEGEEAEAVQKGGTK